MKPWGGIAGFLRSDGIAALISLSAVKGSSPRESGARMVVRKDGAFSGTIGGGALEWQALFEARRLLGLDQATGIQRRRALGPDLGQCCGGLVDLVIEVFTGVDLVWIEPLELAEGAADEICTAGQRDDAGRIVRTLVSADASAAGLQGIREQFGQFRTPVLLFGAGHVGRAVVMALAALPFTVHWFDERAEIFPTAVPGNVRVIDSLDPQSLLVPPATGILALVMTHSHPLDLAIVAKLLPDRRIDYVGLIGSQTKKARFCGQLRTAGLAQEDVARLTCPIGDGLVRDKSPAAIAVCVAVELLQQREQQAGTTVL